MRTQELQGYPIRERLRDGHPSLLKKMRPIFEALVSSILLLPESATHEQRIDCFRKSIEQINVYENEIQTEERETILGIVYEIGEIVGLAAESRFAEKWRGDW